MAQSSTKAGLETLDPYKPFPSLKGKRVKFTSATPYTPYYVQSHTASTPSSGSQAYTSRVQGRQILLENPAKESQLKKERIAKRARQQEDAARRTAGIMSRAEARRSGVWNIDKNITRYETFLPIHHMWCSYMAELMGLGRRPAGGRSGERATPRMPNAGSMHPKLVKADFHGSIIQVRQSKNPSLVGIEGIVILETENTFKIVTRKNVMKVIPKENSVFAFSIPLYAPEPLDLSVLAPPPPFSAASVNGEKKVPGSLIVSPLENEACLEFELYGNQFRFRSTDRATRKFKPKETIEL